MSTLTDSFLQSMVAKLDNENTIGVVLLGSYARGEGGPFSDVDIRSYVRQPPVNPAEMFSMQYLDGYLVSFYLTTLEDEYASLRTPQKAIWAVPGLRQMRILLDKDGSVAALKESAEEFTWESVQAAANAYASWNLAGFAEEVHKILGGLAKRDESMISNATWGLSHGLATTILVQCGVLIQTENAYIDLAQDTAGRESDWTRQFRVAVGLDPLPAGEPAYAGRGIASLRLYRETARLLQNILQPNDATVVNRAMKIIAEAGY
jgi:predicted nucleotidyltransferase